MNIDQNEIGELADKVDPEGGPELADLFLSILELELAARHKKQPRLLPEYEKLIDDERRKGNG